MGVFIRARGLIILTCVLTFLPLSARAQQAAPPTSSPPPIAPATPPGPPPIAPAPAPTAEPAPTDTPVQSPPPVGGDTTGVPPPLDEAGQPAGEVAPPVAPVEPEPDPAEVARELDARIAALDAYLKDQQPRSRSYYGAWISMMGLLTGGQALQAAFNDDPGTRASYIMGSSFSAVGLALVLIAPSPGRYAYSKYKQLPQDSIEQKREKTIQGEEWLRGEAAAVRRTKGWFTHVIGLTLGVGGFLGLYFGYDDNLENALRTGVGTIVVTELRILTRPKRAIRYLDAYRNAPTTVPPASTFALAPLVMPHATGLAMGGQF